MFDLLTNSIFVVVIALRIVAYLQEQEEIRQDQDMQNNPRYKWDGYDPALVSEALFGAATALCILKTAYTYIFVLIPALGPLKVSIDKTTGIIFKLFFFYGLALIAFSCGINQLYWYYAELWTKRCTENPLIEGCANRGTFFMKYILD